MITKLLPPTAPIPYHKRHGACTSCAGTFTFHRCDAIHRHDAYAAPYLELKQGCPWCGSTAPITVTPTAPEHSP